MSENTQEELNTFLSTMVIGDLAELPEYAVLPAGAHRAKFEIGMKKLGESINFCLSLKVIQTMELSSPQTDKVAEPGTEVQILYGADSEFGQGAFRNILKKFLAAQGLDVNDPEVLKATVEQCIAPFKDHELVFITKVQTAKKKPGAAADEKPRQFTNIVDIIFGDFVGIGAASTDNLAPAQAAAPSGMPTLG